jgi:hypothetical protein
LPPFETGPSGVAASAPIPYFGTLELRVRVCEPMAEERLRAELARAESLVAPVAGCLSKELRSELGDIMREAMAELGKPVDTAPPSILAPTEADDHLVDLFEGIDRALEGTARHMFFDAIDDDFEKAPETGNDSKRAKLRAPRVFFVRNAPSAGNGRRVHMLASQRKYFDRLWDQIRGDAPTAAPGSELLRATLDPPGAWFALDAVLQRGVAAWIQLPFPQRADARSADAEACKQMFDALGAGKTGAEGAASLALCIPIHVGLPWLAMLLVFPDLAPEKRGAASWFFYRDVGSYLNNSIRKIILRTYEDRLWRRLLEFFEQEELDPQRLNERLDALTFSLPYPAWQFDIGIGDHKDWVLRLGEGKTLRAKSKAPRSAKDGLRIDLYGYTHEELRDRVASARAFQDAKRVEIAMRRVLSYRDFGHTLKNLLEFTNWDTTRTDVGNLRRSPNVSDEVRDVLTRAYTSLGLFSTVQGLGHLMNVAGRVNASNSDWSKYSSWFDGTRPIDFIDGDADAYAQAAFAVAVAFSETSDISAVEVTCSESRPSERLRVWSHEQVGHPPLVINKLRLAPFQEECDAPFLLVIALVEPLANAIRALEVAAASTGQRHPLKIDVARQSDDCMAVVVSNIGTTVELPTLSGLESARRILEETEMFQLFDPVKVSISEGVFQFTVRLEIRPKTLARLIGGVPTEHS